MKKKLTPAIVALILSSPEYVFANPKSTIELDSVVVIGKKEFNLDKDLAGSVDVITRDELEYEHVTDTLELFSKNPGVVLSRFSQGIVNTEISIRGFTGDGETPHAKLLVDGIPSNLFNGNNEMDYLFPTNIQSIQLFKGTSDATTGLFATAGNLKVETRKDVGKQLQLSYGSFNTREFQGYFGDKSGELTQNYALGYRAGNGWRDNTHIEKIALSGRWQYDFEKSSLALSTKYGKYHAFNAPGYISKQQARDNPEQSDPRAANDGGEKEFKHVSLHYDHFFSNELDLSLKTYTQTLDRERSVRFVGSPGDELRVEDQTSTGLIAKLNWKMNPQWAFETGYDIERQEVKEFRKRLTVIRRDADYDFNAQGVFAKIENTPLDWLRWNFAYRVDHLSIDANKRFVNNNTVLPTTMLKNQTIYQPKLNIFANLTKNQTMFFNAGRSFQTPLGTDLNTINGTKDVDVAINDGWELGLKSVWASKFNTRISYWQQKAEDEFMPVDGTRELIGKTKRQGIDGSFDATLNDFWSLWGNVSLINQKIEKGPDNNRAIDGNRIRGIPDDTASLGVQFAPNSQWTARLHVDRQGSYYVNERNLGGQYGAYTLTNANIDYKTNWGRVSLQANNIFDKDYEYVYDFTSTGGNLNFAPGAGRNFMLSATLDY